MIAALLPYLKWTLKAKHGKVATSQVPKWFKPAAHLRSNEAFWDPEEEFIRNKSDEMLMAALLDADGLPIPRRTPTNWSTPPATEEGTGPNVMRWGHQQGKNYLEQSGLSSRIPAHTDGDLKLDCLNQLTMEYQVDIVTLTELNMAWDKLLYKVWLPQKTCGWWEASHWSVSHNKKDKHGDGFQPGRTAILVLNEWAHQATWPGDDTSS